MCVHLATHIIILNVTCIIHVYVILRHGWPSWRILQRERARAISLSGFGEDCAHLHLHDASHPCQGCFSRCLRMQPALCPQRGGEGPSSGSLMRRNWACRLGNVPFLSSPTRQRVRMGWDRQGPGSERCAGTAGRVRGAAVCPSAPSWVGSHRTASPCPHLAPSVVPLSCTCSSLLSHMAAKYFEELSHQSREKKKEYQM